MIRAFGSESLLNFLKGSSAALAPAPVPPGDQPSDERALGFPQLLGFHVEHSQGSVDVFGVTVDESTQ